jgi:hypothetical protein
VPPHVWIIKSPTHSERSQHHKHAGQGYREREKSLNRSQLL